MNDFDVITCPFCDVELTRAESHSSLVDGAYLELCSPCWHGHLEMIGDTRGIDAEFEALQAGVRKRIELEDKE